MYRPPEAPARSVEEQQEVPQELRILRQLGDYAEREVALDNPVFKSFMEGRLGEEQIEQMKIVADQLDFMEGHIKKLAELCSAEAVKGKSDRLAAALDETAAFLGTHAHQSSTSFIRPESLVLLGRINEISSRKNYIEMAAAVYALMRIAESERLMKPETMEESEAMEESEVMEEPETMEKAEAMEEPEAEDIRQTVHGELLSTGTFDAQPRVIPQPQMISSPVRQRRSHPRLTQETRLVDHLEQGLSVYVSARYTFQECILKGIDAVIEAKKQFYATLSDPFGPSQSPRNMLISGSRGSNIARRDNFAE